MCDNGRYGIEDFCGRVPSHLTLRDFPNNTRVITDLPACSPATGTGYVNKNECELHPTRQHARLPRCPLQPTSSSRFLAYSVLTYTCSMHIACEWGSGHCKSPTDDMSADRGAWGVGRAVKVPFNAATHSAQCSLMPVLGPICLHSKLIPRGNGLRRLLLGLYTV
jgi:hypothetical protein